MPRVDGSLNIKGLERRFSVYIPKTVANRPPVLLALHGGKARESMTNPRRGIIPGAEKYGYIAVFPYGINDGWEVGFTGERSVTGTDLAFLSQLIAFVVERFQADPTRVYMTGFSIGAMMTFRAGAYLSSQIAGICPVNGAIGGRPTQLPPGCPLPPDAVQLPDQVVVNDPVDAGARPVNVLIVHGAADTPEGGPNPKSVEKLQKFCGIGLAEARSLARNDLPTSQALALWAQADGATEPVAPELPEIPRGTQVRALRNPANGYLAAAVVDPGRAHEWPSWDVVGLMWRFFISTPARTV